MKTIVALPLALALLLCGLEPASAQQAPAPAWRLLVFHAFRPGILSLCENAHLKPDFERHALPDAGDPLKARWLTEAASVQWRGGRFAQPASADTPPSPRLLTDACFTLFVNGAPVISGGVVPKYSARRFDFPALVVEGLPTGAPLALTLARRFPVQPDEPMPAVWAEWLRGLSGPSPASSVCPPREGGSLSQIDVFDGDPTEQVTLAPDDDRKGANTYTVKHVYAQGRAVTIRCHFGKEAVDVKLSQPVAACRYSEASGRPLLTCK